MQHIGIATIAYLTANPARRLVQYYIYGPSRSGFGRAAGLFALRFMHFGKRHDVKGKTVDSINTHVGRVHWNDF